MSYQYLRVLLVLQEDLATVGVVHYIACTTNSYVYILVLCIPIYAICYEWVKPWWCYLRISDFTHRHRHRLANCHPPRWPFMWRWANNQLRLTRGFTCRAQKRFCARGWFPSVVGEGCACTRPRVRCSLCVWGVSSVLSVLPDPVPRYGMVSVSTRINTRTDWYYMYMYEYRQLLDLILRL